MDMLTSVSRSVIDETLELLAACMREPDAESFRELHRVVLGRLIPFANDLISERDDLRARLTAARRDPVTGLPTRAAFIEAAVGQLSHPDAQAVLVLDVDYLKPVNDHLGHVAGDALLKAVGSRLAQWCGADGVAGRLGGDEFAVVTGAGSDLDRRLGSLRGELNRPVPYAGRALPSSVSMGVALSTETGRALNRLLGLADDRMYEWKGRGRRGRHAPSRDRPCRG